ncbi:MAG: VanZ family protein [Anaerobacillus sp.]
MFINRWKWSILTLFMMGVLFISSNTPYQEQDMKPFFKDFITITETNLPPIEFTYDHSLVTPTKPYDYVEFFIRKAAHVASFGLLAILSILAFKEFRRTRPLLLGAALTLSYALFDEFHQSWIQGRTGHLIDVFVPDTLGILLALLGFKLIELIRLSNKKNPRF